MVSSFFRSVQAKIQGLTKGKCLFVRASNLYFFNVIRTKWELTVINENTWQNSICFCASELFPLLVYPTFHTLRIEVSGVSTSVHQYDLYSKVSGYPKHAFSSSDDVLWLEMVRSFIRVSYLEIETIIFLTANFQPEFADLVKCLQ